MKQLLLLAALSLAVTANATERFPSNTANAGAAALAGGGSGTGGNSSTDNNLLMLPSTTSAVANSGNVPIVCQVITVVSEATQYAFGAYSKSQIGKEPARVNFVCVLYHNAVQSGKSEDWKRFVDYSEEVAKGQAAK